MFSKKIISLIVTTALLLSACGSPASNSVQKNDKAGALEGVITIGGQFPLTGELGSLGNSIRDGALLAVMEINAAGGVNGKELKMVVEDDQCDQTIAVSAFNKLISTDKVLAVVGSVCSPPFQAMAPIAEENKVVIISPGATNKDISFLGGDYGFRTVASDSFRMQKLAEFAYDQLEKKTIAVVYINNDYGVNAKKDFVKKFEELGGIVTLDEAFNPGNTDFRTVIQKVKSSGAAGFYQIAYGEGTGLIYKQAVEIGLEGEFFNGYEAPGDPQALELAKNAMNGVWYAAVQQPTDEFAAAYKARYGEEPLAYAAEAYDAVMLIADAINGGALTGEQIKNALYQVQDYTGASGTYSIDENGDVEKQFDLVQIQDEKPVVVRPL